ncbi:NACHT domain-containing NTPase [Polaribacter sp. KT 15]|uniref:NACHT domain-containing protein n=1 Tax=Polaribacter sp. KT 15 TaxID=1896175 RepID=UPI00090B7FD4|nr:NACHT domain-containing protein [Polaribacter sp. KT 15]SHN08408.1 NACHT domain-containing protein [Polaribacter sp. KT 15]
MDIDTLKNIATIAAPFTKAILDTYLVPKFKELGKKWNKDQLLIDHYFESKFQDYLNESFEKNAVLNTIAYKKRKVLLNDVYLPLNLICEQNREEIKIENFDNQLFEETNKILITDTAGMGKSTLVKKMLISCIEQNQGVPLLIELRRLSKSKGIIDEIIEQFNSINEKIDKQFILDLIKRGDFIFFLDGFDEISLSERAFVTTDIEKFVSKARANKFILTSRPEDALSSFGEFKKFKIKALNSNEAFDLLKKYDNHGVVSKLLISKLEEKEVFQNIEEYLTTPLLVSLLYTAFEHKQKIPFKKHVFYRQVYDALFETHDLSKGNSFERDKYCKLGSDDFHRVLRIFGYLCLKSGNKIEFTRDELTTTIQKAIDYCGDLDIKPSDFIKDLLSTVPIFNKDGIYFKWSHKSLQEYFTAQFIYLDSKEKQNDMLTHISFHPNNKSYFNVLDLYKSIDPVGFESIVTYKLLNDFLDFTKNTYKNFSGNEKLARQQFCFNNDIYLINAQPNTKVDVAEFVFNLMRKQFNNKYVPMSIMLADDTNISNIKTPVVDKPYKSLIQFFYKQRADFVYRNNEDFKKLSVNFKLPKNKLHKVTDRKNSILNKGENFKKTNDIIRFYSSRPNNIFIDKTKAEYIINIINSKKEKKSNDDLLDF